MLPTYAVDRLAKNFCVLAPTTFLVGTDRNDIKQDSVAQHPLGATLPPGFGWQPISVEVTVVPVGRDADLDATTRSPSCDGPAEQEGQNLSVTDGYALKIPVFWLVLPSALAGRPSTSGETEGGSLQAAQQSMRCAVLFVGFVKRASTVDNRVQTLVLGTASRCASSRYRWLAVGAASTKLPPTVPLALGGGGDSSPWYCPPRFTATNPNETHTEPANTSAVGDSCGTTRRMSQRSGQHALQLPTHAFEHEVRHHRQRDG